MKRLTITILLMMISLALLISCGSDGDDTNDGDNNSNGDILKKEGESCTKISDCESGLDCIDLLCAKKADLPSSLTWQNPPSEDTFKLEEAIDYCNKLSFDGHDDWHLPNVDELRSLISGCTTTKTDGTCNIATDNCMENSCKNDDCMGCDWDDNCGYWGQELKGACGDYWTSSLEASDSEKAWHISFGNAYVMSIDTFVKYYVRCVR